MPRGLHDLCIPWGILCILYMCCGDGISDTLVAAVWIICYNTHNETIVKIEREGGYT